MSNPDAAPFVGSNVCTRRSVTHPRAGIRPERHGGAGHSEDFERMGTADARHRPLATTPREGMSQFALPLLARARRVSDRTARDEFEGAVKERIIFQVTAYPRSSLITSPELS